MMHAITKIRRLLLLASLLVVLYPVVATAETYYLRAAETTVDLPGVGPVPMWGYALEPDNVSVAGTVTVPGPELRVTNGDLDVYLRNELSEPTSLVIDSQSLPSSGANPVEFSDGTRQRMRSVTAEAAPGGQQLYSWTGLKPGTFLYHSGSHMSIQPSMGLYGAMINVAPDPLVYPGESYDAEVTLLYSEVDIDQHQAVASGTYGTVVYPTTMAAGYEIDYFLLNGKSYTSDQLPLQVTTEDRVLLRMLNAGLRDRVPVIPGVTLDVVAEDGHLYSQSFQQNSINLPPSKTMDVLITAPAAAGYLPIFDRRLGLHDVTNTSYGMLTYLAVNAPIPLTSSLTVNLVNPGPSDRVFMSSSPGGIDCPGDCAEPAIIAGTDITLTADVGSGSALFAWRIFDGDPTAGGARLPDSCDGLAYCPIDMTAARWVEAEFKSFSKVTIIAPSASTVLTPGSYYMVRWAAPATSETFNVSYNLGPGTPWVSLAEGITDLQTQWHIPAELGNRGTPRLSVVGYDATGAVDSSALTVFKINLQDQITLIAPNGMEVLSGGDLFDISWSQSVAATPVAAISLQYQETAGTPWIPITTIDPVATPGQTYSWTVPTLSSATTDARVGILLFDGRGKVLVQDTSDVPFTINPPVVVLNFAAVAAAIAPQVAETSPVMILLPNGGEHILAANGFTVLWQADETVVTSLLELSTDGGATWSELAADLTGTQFDWQVASELVGKETLLRITAFDAEGKSLGSDVSDESFMLE